MKLFFGFFIVLIPSFLFAQSYEKEYVTLFAWEVKQIDEFIERFNDSDDALIKEYNKEYQPKVVLTREKLLKSLFNASKTDWNYTEITSFVQQVITSNPPLLLDFNAENWYANVTCTVLWKGKPKTVLCKLKIMNLPDGSCKWVLSDVSAKFLLPKDANGKPLPIEQPQLPMPNNKLGSLNPMSHTNDFLNIDMVSENTKNLSNYIEPSAHYSDMMSAFIRQILNKNLKILQTNYISYVFCQIDGWKIEIQQFNRPTKNSGWLINKLIRIPS
ncbi:hypothetical protein [Flavobacterium sp.]|uniref:hypothetical protein n=1 Tax=Flavobacterium sp. TaxID=239 RepID=UPI00286ADC06|nr:hypothetical protein [Flavobacterium sp.]